MQASSCTMIIYRLIKNLITISYAMVITMSRENLFPSNYISYSVISLPTLPMSRWGKRVAKEERAVPEWIHILGLVGGMTLQLANW